MNDRILEFARESGLMKTVHLSGTENSIDFPVTSSYAIEKFGELIVNECATVARKHLLEKADRSYLMHKIIKNHFGIE